MGECAGCGRPVSEPRCGFCGVARAPRGYAVEKVLAQGPHGRVYRARSPSGSVVALKELQFANVPGAQQIDAFEREAAMLKTLHHPRIPHYVDSFKDGEGVQLRLYLAAEFIEGESLSARISRAPFSAAELRDLAGQVLQVLAYLHALGVLHRDIKPDNLIVRPGGEVVLVDFGSARQLTSDSTYGSTLVGTFGYMPTEQLGGTVDASSDLYALGATLLHAASGKPPSDLLSGDMVLTVPAGLPLRELIVRLVQPRRERRLHSAAAALAMLQDPRPQLRVRPRFALLAASALCITLLSFVRGPAPAAEPSVAVSGLPRSASAAQRWYAVAKQSCNPVEVAQLMSRRPPPEGWDGKGFGAGCWALAGRIDEARSMLAQVRQEDRWRAAGIVFDIAHPVADAGDDIAAAPIMNLVLESWPNHFQALYHAGMSDYALGHAERARTHLTGFLRLYKEEDGFTRNAREALARIR
ncbi:MAG TPA: protein kinase [Myxococcales bacterium]|nr:protein kinase [Myxococcales bacterium]